MVRVKLRKDRYRELMTAKGWERPADQARAIGVSQPQVQRVLDDENAPGTAFIGGLLQAFPGFKFEYFFELVDEQDPAEVAP